MQQRTVIKEKYGCQIHEVRTIHPDGYRHQPTFEININGRAVKSFDHISLVFRYLEEHHQELSECVTS